MHVAVGFGVLGFQRAQVRRRELTRLLENQLGAGTNDVASLVAAVDRRVRPLEVRVAGALDAVEAQLPSPVDDLMHTMRSGAAAARDIVRRRLVGDDADASNQLASPNA